jgi:hypothetical protein
MYKKITTGFVVQDFDEDGKCFGAEFVAEDASQVEWEDELGNSIPPIEHEYCPFEMVSPTAKKDSSASFCS